MPSQHRDCCDGSLLYRSRQVFLVDAPNQCFPTSILADELREELANLFGTWFVTATTGHPMRWTFTYPLLSILRSPGSSILSRILTFSTSSSNVTTSRSLKLAR